MGWPLWDRGGKRTFATNKNLILQKGEKIGPLTGRVSGGMNAELLSGGGVVPCVEKSNGIKKAPCFLHGKKEKKMQDLMR